MLFLRSSLSSFIPSSILVSLCSWFFLSFSSGLSQHRSSSDFLRISSCSLTLARISMLRSYLRSSWLPWSWGHFRADRVRSQEGRRFCLLCNRSCLLPFVINFNFFPTSGIDTKVINERGLQKSSRSLWVVFRCFLGTGFKEKPLISIDSMIQYLRYGLGMKF